MYVVELYECGAFGNFVKVLGYTYNLELANKYEAMYEKSDDYYVVIAKVFELK